MAQAAFPFETLAASQHAWPVAPSRAQAAAASRDAEAFEIGWDHAHHRLTPPLAHLQAENPVHHGWRAGRTAFGLRTLRATPAVRQWLTLRLQAWVQGVVFEGVQLTPHFVRQLSVTHCPITREALTHDRGDGSDGVIERLFNGAAMAAGNLAQISQRAQQAVSGTGWSHAQAQAAQLAHDADAHIDGLNCAEWQRATTLMSFATPLPHAVAATLPLHMLPPPRVRVQNPVQAVQVVLTLLFQPAQCTQRMVALAALLPQGDTRQAYQVFMHTWLARRLAIQPEPEGTLSHQALEDLWLDPLIRRRWQRLALRLTPMMCEQFLQRAAAQGLIGRSSQWLSAEQATQGWALASAGRVQAEPADGHGVPATASPTPGSLRNSGSQYPANCDAVTALGVFQ